MDTIILGTTLQNWLVVAGIIAGSLIVLRIIGALLKATARRINSRLMIAIVEQAEPPVATLLLLFGLRTAVEFVAVAPEAGPWIDLGFKFLVVLVLTWLIVQIYEAIHVSLLTPLARSSDGPSPHLFAVLRTLVRLLIWIVGLATALRTIGLEVSAVLAALGIGGIALALASQDTVANVFGGFVVLFQRPFKVGERIEVGGVEGWVEHLGLRTTTIRNLQGRCVLIPNKKFTDSIVTNIDSQTGYRTFTQVRIAATTPPELVARALQIFHEIVEECEVLHKQHYVSVSKIDIGSIELDLRYEVLRWSASEAAKFTDGYAKELAGRSFVHIEILRRFAAEDIHLAVPLLAHVDAPGRRQSSAGPVFTPNR